MLEFVKIKKIDIDIPKIEKFVHRTYIAIARKLYKNIYLFEQECSPLTKQKNNRELELIIRECIINTIRETIPIDKILRAYMSEKMEEEVIVEEEQPKQSDISNNIVADKLETQTLENNLEERITIAKDPEVEPETSTTITATPNPMDKIEDLKLDDNKEKTEETVIDFTKPVTPPTSPKAETIDVPPPPPVPIKQFEIPTVTNEIKETVTKELDNLVSDETLKIGSGELDLAELDIDNFDTTDNTVMRLND